MEILIWIFITFISSILPFLTIGWFECQNRNNFFPKLKFETSPQNERDGTFHSLQFSNQLCKNIEKIIFFLDSPLRKWRSTSRKKPNKHWSSRKVSCKARNLEQDRNWLVPCPSGGAVFVSNNTLELQFGLSIKSMTSIKIQGFLKVLLFWNHCFFNLFFKYCTTNGQWTSQLDRAFSHGFGRFISRDADVLDFSWLLILSCLMVWILNKMIFFLASSAKTV